MKGRTYRYFEGTPLYPFGYGLSYTTFAYSGLKLPTAPVTAGEPIAVQRSQLTNTGKVAGDEVVAALSEFSRSCGAPLMLCAASNAFTLSPAPRRRCNSTCSRAT